MSSFQKLYLAYRALHRIDGKLYWAQVSNDSEKVELYRYELEQYRKKAISNLEQILQQLAKRLLEEKDLII